MRILLALMGLMVFSLVIHAEEEPLRHTKESLEEVSDRIERREGLLVDVRTEEEWKEAHVQGARWLPLRELKRGVDEDAELLEKLLARLPKPDRKKTLYMHCKVGARALAAARILRKLGYDARPLEPGIEELLQGGFPRAEKHDLAAAPKEESEIQLDEPK